MNTSSGKLIIVPTPIGNLGDMTLRAQQALAAADTVCAEDTRVTAKLLALLDIHKPLERLDEQVLGVRADGIVQRVLSGEVICYCTDAGMPAISDPGARLISAARKACAVVEVLPGASAASLAYVASGTQNTHYYFGGFFPRKAAEACKLLDSLSKLDAALIFYESPKRLLAALKTIADCFPSREIAVCRELTKLHEEIVRDISGEVLQIFTMRADSQPIKGEIAIVIDAPVPQEISRAQDDALLAAANVAAELALTGLRVKDISRQIADDFQISRNSAYEIALKACNLQKNN